MVLLPAVTDDNAAMIVLGYALGVVAVILLWPWLNGRSWFKKKY